MSVPSSERSISRLEVYNNANVIRNILTRHLLTDFGIKNKVRAVEQFIKPYGMNEEDHDRFFDIIERYNMTPRIAEVFPSWWISHRRDTLDTMCTELIISIRKANSVYPRDLTAAIYQRNLKYDVLGNVEALEEEVQYLITILNKTLDIDINKYSELASAILNEIGLVKGWIKASNTVIDDFRNKKRTGGAFDMNSIAKSSKEKKSFDPSKSINYSLSEIAAAGNDERIKQVSKKIASENELTAEEIMDIENNRSSSSMPFDED